MIATAKCRARPVNLQLSKGKRLLIKDICHYIVPPNGKPASIAPSLQRVKRGVGTTAQLSEKVNGTEEITEIASETPYPFATTEAEPGNPTVFPVKTLEKFHFTFLLRDPHSSIPSYYRCTVPPLDSVTGFYEFYPSEAGYQEIRRVFDYLRQVGHIGPHLNGKNLQAGGSKYQDSNQGGVDICVVDADDLLDDPAGMIKAYCQSVGLKYEPEMLSWNSDGDQRYAEKSFEKWKGFHDDALNSKELRPRAHVSTPFP